jgi:hypothetical protein
LPGIPGAHTLSGWGRGEMLNVVAKRWGSVATSLKALGLLASDGATRGMVSPSEPILQDNLRPREFPGLIVGHSHLICFGVPVRTEDGSLAITPLEGPSGDFFCLNGAFARRESYWAEAERLASDYRLFIYWEGNQHSWHLFASEPRYDFVLSEQPELQLDNDAIIIPEQMLREEFAPTLLRLEELLTNAVSRGPRNVFVCGTPPPKGDLRFIRACLGKEIFFAYQVAEKGMTAKTVPLTSPLILYKMWCLMQTMLQEVTEKCGARFLPLPREVQTSDGFLKKEYWSSDVSHANSTLGRFMLPHLREHL